MAPSIQIVSGFMRSGTSMMMQCLTSGGLTPAYSDQREEMQSFGDEYYKPNKGGFFEVSLSEYREIGFPLNYQGKLIKIMSWGLDGMTVNPDGYRIVFMLRDPEEIRQSHEAAFNESAHVPKDYRERMASIIERMRNRKDVLSITPLEYREVIDNPQAAFEKLTNDGWRIDVNSAINIVDPTQCRFRIEELVEGI